MSPRFVFLIIGLLFIGPGGVYAHPGRASAGIEPGGIGSPARSASSTQARSPKDPRLLGLLASKKQRFPSLGALRTEQGATVPLEEVQDFILVPESKTQRFRLHRDWPVGLYGLALVGLGQIAFEPAVSALSRGELHGAVQLAWALAATGIGYHLGDLGLRVGHSIMDGYSDGKAAAPFVNHHAAVGEQSVWSPLEVASLYVPRALRMGALSFGVFHLALPHGFAPEIAAATLGGMTAWITGNLFHREAHRDWEQAEARAKGEPLPFPERGRWQKGLLSFLRRTGFALTPEWHKMHHGDGTKRFGTGSQIADKLYDPVFYRAVTLLARATASRPGGPVIHRAFLEHKRWLATNPDLMLAYLKAHPELATTPAELPGPAGLKFPYSVPTRLAHELNITPDRLSEVVAFLEGDRSALVGDADAELRHRLGASSP